MNGVTEYLQTYRSMLYTDANGEEKTAYVIVPQDTSRMADYVNLSSRDGKNTYVMDDSGVIITEKLAKTLGVSVGDTVTFKTSETGTATEPVKVAGIVENYMYHYIYMTPNVYKQLLTRRLRSIPSSLNGRYRGRRDSIKAAYGFERDKFGFHEQHHRETDKLSYEQPTVYSCNTDSCCGAFGICGSL